LPIVKGVIMLNLSTIEVRLFCLYLLLSIVIFNVYDGFKVIGASTEGFQLTGPTHCFNVGPSYDSKFLFSITSLGYRGRVDFEVIAPEGTKVELRTPVILNSTGSRIYCPVTVQASSSASQGEHSIVVTAKGGSYSDSISICIIITGFMMLTLQTSPAGVPTDLFLDNTEYHLESNPLILQIRTGKHTLEIATKESDIGARHLARKGLTIIDSTGNKTEYGNQGKSLAFTLVGNSTLVVLFEEVTTTENETNSWKMDFPSGSVPVALVIALVSIGILLYATMSIIRKNTTFAGTYQKTQAIIVKRRNQC